MANRTKQRRDSKHRVLRRGESIRDNGKYQFKYHVDGKPHFVYSWRLEPTDPQPVGKKPCLSMSSESSWREKAGDPEKLQSSLIWMQKKRAPC